MNFHFRFVPKTFLEKRFKRTEIGTYMKIFVSDTIWFYTLIVTHRVERYWSTFRHEETQVRGVDMCPHLYE